MRPRHLKKAVASRALYPRPGVVESLDLSPDASPEVGTVDW